MLKFHINIIKFSIFTNKNSQSDTFYSKSKNTIVKIALKNFLRADVFFWSNFTLFVSFTLMYFLSALGKQAEV